MDTFKPLKSPFVEEIDYNEIELLEVVGKGSFGVVSKGKWQGKFVAVKKIEGESEKKAFLVERHQLSRVNHPNIVKLYGACTKSPVCLVMEYAEGGSLYNVLHATPRARYTASHAISWALQCARGVSYLHDMKPKALIHRDLKPPNLLLIMGGTVLKICDFGTACDIQTHMTNSKGSAAWMAPEVFEGYNYSEKCDVFSWGIILWEVLTRHRPFAELGTTAYSIMWAVHNGNRPPLIQGCPLVIEKLMCRCWDKNPQRRPPMSEVVETMTEIFKYFKGADEPITFASSDDESCSQSEDLASGSEDPFSPEVPGEETPLSPTISESLNVLQNLPVTITTSSPPTSKWVGKPIPPSLMEPISIQVENKPPTPTMTPLLPVMQHSKSMLQISAPPSLASSHENLTSSSSAEDINLKRLSADFSHLGTSGAKLDQYSGIKKTASYGSLTSNPSPASYQLKESPKKVRTPLQPVVQTPISKFGNSTSNVQSLIRDLPQDYAHLGFYHLMLEPQYQPLQPLPDSSESMKVFEEHNKLAQEYIRVQAETSLLLKRREEISEELTKEQTQPSDRYTEADKYINEMLELQTEKQGLESLYQNLRRQLQILKKKPPQKNVTTDDDWVVLE